MNSLNYLQIRTAKNRLLELKKRPGMIALYAGIIIFIVYSVINSLGMEMPEGVVNFNILRAIFFGFFMLSFITIAEGFKSGNNVYEMQDVNYLFTSPIKSRTVLLYGIIKSFKVILLGSWFIFFQAQWLRQGFGVTISGVLIIGATYLVLSLVCRLLAIFIYAFTQGNSKRKNIAKIILIAIFLPVIILFLYEFIQSGYNIGESFNATLDSPIVAFTPIIGWASFGVVAIITGDIIMAAVLIGLLILSGLFFFICIFFSDPDFYEDAQGVTQKTFEVTNALQEGSANDALMGTTRNVKVKKTGLGGFGASVFFYKHMRESFRKSPLGLWGLTSFILVGVAVIMAFSFSGGDDSNAGMVSILTSIMFTMLMLAGQGRGNLELYCHIIYMIPDSPLKKWIWANIEIVLKSGLESIVIFVIAGIILQANILTIITAILACSFFSIVPVGINLISMRVIKRKLSMGITLIVYFLLVALVMAPGVVLAVITATILPEAIAVPVAFMILAVWELLIGFLCFLASKGVLHNTDIESTENLIK